MTVTLACCSVDGDFWGRTVRVLLDRRFKRWDDNGWDSGDNGELDWMHRRVLIGRVG